MFVRSVQVEKQVEDFLSKNKVVLFETKNYLGNLLPIDEDFLENVHYLMEFEFKSIKIPSNFYVVMRTVYNKLIKLDENTPSFDTPIFNMVMRAYTTNVSITLHKLEGYNGQYTNINEEFLESQNNVINDYVGSLQIPKNYYIIITEKQGGPETKIYDDQKKFNKHIAQMYIRPKRPYTDDDLLSLGYVLLFSGERYIGHMSYYNSEYLENSNNEIGPIEVKSIKIPDDLQIYFNENGPLVGNIPIIDRAMNNYNNKLRIEAREAREGRVYQTFAPVPVQSVEYHSAPVPVSAPSTIVENVPDKYAAVSVEELLSQNNVVLFKKKEYLGDFKGVNEIELKDNNHIINFKFKSIKIPPNYNVVLVDYHNILIKLYKHTPSIDVEIFSTVLFCKELRKFICYGKL